MDKYVVVLAAGKGTRMKSSLPKVLHQLAGKTMLAHVLKSTEALSAKETIVVVGFEGDEVAASLPQPYKKIVRQEEQLGTGHAVLQTQAFLAGKSGQTLVVYGDMPLITGETLKALFETHEREKAQATVLTAITKDPFGYGRIVRKDGQILKIVEEKDASAKERELKEINTGIYIFDNQLLFKALESLTPSNAQGEYYLTDVMEFLKNDGQKISSLILDDFSQSLGVNDRVQLSQAATLLKKRINRQHMLAGVTLEDPDSTYIQADVEIGSDTLIEGSVVINGATTIGKNCQITAGSRLVDATLRDNVRVESSTIEASTLEEGANCGPYAHLRPGSTLAPGVHVGNFVEIKASTIGKGTKIGHLSYVGNASVGADVNIGAGTITVNYDGKSKYETQIGDNSFIGSNSTLIAPLEIGENALIAAGSTITEAVKTDDLAIGRARQVNKSEGAKSRPHYKEKHGL